MNQSCFQSSAHIPEEQGIQEITGFLDVIDPLINQGRHRLHEGIQTLIQRQSNLPFAPSTVEKMLFANLAKLLLGRVSRTLVLELNVARLQGLLKGNTPKERFHSFLHRLRHREMAKAILQEYPVLARQLTISIDQWVTFSLDFLHHLCVDWQVIQTTFSPNKDLGMLVGLDWGMGDSHRGGRSVLIAKFSSGFQLVYKPRSLAIDVHFQELLRWLNNRGNHPPLRTLRILNRDTYGWVEFLVFEGCSSPEEIRRFYERQGSYLALLYALEATDFHFENLIAIGENPVLIDLETLFQARMAGISTTSLGQVTANTMSNSVLRVGLLPRRRWMNEKSEGIELSGLGGATGQLTPNDVLYLEGEGSDEMRFIRKSMKMPGGQNQPTLNGVKVDVLDYTEAITTGFTKVYRLLLQHRNQLLSNEGPLACFAEDEVRVVLRPTQIYSELLYESFHPDVLRNTLDRDRLFDRLWLNIEQQPYLAKVIAAERNDLWQDDIPLFTTCPNSRDIWSSSGQQIFNFFEESGMTSVQRRLQKFSEVDLKQQLWFIRASLTTLLTKMEQQQWSIFSLREPQNSASREQLLGSARAVGDYIEMLALCTEQEVSWIGLTLIKKKYWTLTPLRIDLYDGLPGVVLFLAYLGNLTQEKRYTVLAKAALRELQRQIEINKELLKSIGGFDGWGGVIYTLTQLSVLWDESELLNQAESLVDLLLPLIAEDERFDIIGGAAGCIGSLINLYHCKPSPTTLAAAIQCGDHLIAKAQPMEHGIGWILKNVGTKPLTGFSHGSAGIAWVLLELAALTGEERFRTTALEAIAYERSLFRPELGNWPDLRDFTDTVLQEKDNQYTCMTAWCHGAPGIGLARLRSFPYLDDAEIRAEINTALKTTLSQGFGGNHSLCHGDLGNLELLLQASQTLDEPYWKTEVNRLAAIILESIEKHGWLCGVPLGVETPGLMTGLAGIGYQLLRLTEPERVPSVLVLESPKLDSTVIQKAEKAIATR